ncbi:hypothetical protein LTR37_008685 [Vermiconidia calcicola]|uniref:Uncharacterized protein n=1 Tax=Vermiconidia calcicola TaxID=1690605 RepID=A0ACC3NBB5_9PEZI|nr:hypothetical protein LTR37_008685 [Vermiconidia calcicola]
MSAALTTNVDQRLLRTTKFPPEFNTKVDLKKVNVQLIKAWVGEEIAKILKSEDDVVTDLVTNILEESRYPNIKELQISLTGFLDKDAAPFCAALWKLCLSAQQSPHGVPKELLEAKKAELAQAKAEEDKAREEAIKRQEAERERDRELARTRERERNERSDRGRGRGRGGRGGRDFDRRPPRDSRSRTPPPRRRREDDDDFRRPPPRGVDTYIPRKGRHDDRPPRHRRSPSYGRSSSRSRSPPRRRRRRDDSASRSPPRKKRNSSSDHGSSRDRDYARGHTRRHKSRSPPSRRRRSPSPKRQNRRPPAPDRSRSPPPKRSRRASPSPARPSTSESRSSAHSQKSPARRKKEADLAPDDLMSTNRRKESFRNDSRRLSREPTSPSVSRSETPLTDDRSRRGSAISVEAASKKTTAGAQQPFSASTSAFCQSLTATQFREKELKRQLLARTDLRRRYSVLGNSQIFPK